MNCLIKRYAAALLAVLLLVLSAMFIGPVVWRMGKREVVRLQSQSRWESWCANQDNEPSDGDPCGWLSIQSCGIDSLVLLGGSKENLAESVCMETIKCSSHEGEAAVRVISGHRDTHFRKLRKVAEGDAIELFRADGKALNYRVADIETVPSGELDRYLAEQRHPSWIALLTCYPFKYIGPAPERYVVWCEPNRRVTGDE